MKKTLRTVMTSAMFAATVGVSAGNMPVSGASAQSAGASAHPAEEPTATQTTTTELQLEGVPVVFEETTTTDEVIFDGVAPMPETTEPELELGGDIPIIEGDLNFDFRVDASDLTLLKRNVLEHCQSINGVDDLNGDGQVDKEDVKALLRMLTGKSKEEEDAEEAQQTTTTVTEELLTTLTTSTEMLPPPLYGPPVIVDIITFD